MDAGLIYKGYHSDAARTHFVGQVSPEVKKLVEEKLKNRIDHDIEKKEDQNSKEFIVYINAETGKEEDILIVLNTPNGVLTI